MLIERVRGARTPEHPEGCDLVLSEGRVVSSEPASSGAGFDVAGRVVLPAFVDAHVHLDKAFAPGSVPAELPVVLAAMAAQRASTPLTETARRARRAADALVRNGTTAARVMVEIEPLHGLDLLVMHERLADAVADRLALQLVAFPQNGLAATGMAALMAAALSEGADVVGGCPYADADPAAHLDIVFGLADRYHAPVDLHLDFGDDPAASLIGLVAERTAAHGMAGQVTIGHVTTLAAMDPYTQALVLETLAAQGISLVVLPATDLWLTGQGEPGTRSLAPYERARAAGVRTAIGNNNIANPFAPFGNASQLQAAWLAGLIRRSADAAGLLAAITAEPAAILGLEPHGTRPGEWADLVVLDHDDVSDALVQAPPVHRVVRRGVVSPPWLPEPVAAQGGASSVRADDHDAPGQGISGMMAP
ncbi:amidohydrolase family protein [Acidothermaceae bacterium B102]|nr:amidohydrolase family protein [Acidothermaceae bacterium B102]